MKREELIALLRTVRGDCIRSGGLIAGNPSIMAIADACTFAIWHLEGEPSFVERNDAKREQQS